MQVTCNQSGRGKVAVQTAQPLPANQMSLSLSGAALCGFSATTPVQASGQCWFVTLPADIPVVKISVFELDFSFCMRKTDGGFLEDVGDLEC